MGRLLILTAGRLDEDPRARRALRHAEARGIPVVLISGAAPQGAADGGRAQGAPAGAETGRRPGVVRRLGPVGRELRGLVRLARLVRVTARLVRASRAVDGATVVHANDFDTLPAATIAARRLRARVVYDAHEIYTDQEPDPPRLQRLAIRLLEGPLARRATVVTVGPLIAQELERRLRLPTPPVVVLNCPARAVAVTRPRGQGPLRVIYQGAAGPGRLLSDILEAARHCGDDVRVTIRVARADLEALRADVRAAGLGDRVDVSDPVPPDALVEALGDHDVGLIINRPLTRNDELVFPNKLFEYMMAGLAVVAPDLPELGPFLGREQVGRAFAAGDPRAMGETLAALAADRRSVEQCRARASELALERYNSEIQARELERAWGLAADGSQVGTGSA